jgi:hypothetical protein
MGAAKFVSRIGLTALAATMSVGSAMAQETPVAASSPSLKVELNALQPSERGCRFTFIATNQLGGELKSVGFELVLFNKAGMVSRITIVDFKDLPQGKTKVRQFDFSGVKCADLGRVLVNDATDCAGEGMEPKACIRYLQTETRAETEFGV